MNAPEAGSDGLIVLETARLVLRPLVPDDTVAFHRVCNDREVARYLFDGEPVSMETARSLIEQSRRDFAGGGVGLFAVRRRGAEAPGGFCGFFTVEGVGEPELTYGLLPALWGRGFATEAAGAVASHALARAGFRRVLAATEEANAASLRVIERLGARPLGKVVPSLPHVVYFELARDAEDERERWTR